MASHVKLTLYGKLLTIIAISAVDETVEGGGAAIYR